MLVGSFSNQNFHKGIVCRRTKSMGECIIWQRFPNRKARPACYRMMSCSVVDCSIIFAFRIRVGSVGEARGAGAVERGLILKLDRASGECLGAVCRRRTCQAAIRGRERQARNDLPISEWGNPAGVTTRHPLCGGARGELKHLSTLRKRKQMRLP